MKTQLFQDVRPVFYVIGLAAITLSLFWGLHLRVNLSPSMPIGIYRQLNIHSLQRGMTVSVCLPKRVAQTGLRRGFIGRGHCPGGVEPVVKKLIAIPGDHLVVTHQGITVNGHFYWTPVHEHDLHNAPLERWAHDGTIVSSLGYWLYGSGAPNLSWDSRYFADVSKANIHGIYHLMVGM